MIDIEVDIMIMIMIVYYASLTPHDYYGRITYQIIWRSVMAMAYQFSEKNLQRNIDRLRVLISSGATTCREEIDKRLKEIKKVRAMTHTPHRKGYISFVRAEIIAIILMEVDNE